MIWHKCRSAPILFSRNSNSFVLYANFCCSDSLLFTWVYVNIYLLSVDRITIHIYNYEVCVQDRRSILNIFRGLFPFFVCSFRPCPATLSLLLWLLRCCVRNAYYNNNDLQFAQNKKNRKNNIILIHAHAHARACTVCPYLLVTTSYFSAWAYPIISITMLVGSVYYIKVHLSLLLRVVFIFIFFLQLLILSRPAFISFVLYAHLCMYILLLNMKRLFMNLSPLISLIGYSFGYIHYNYEYSFIPLSILWEKP